jgi:KDO2-lipid IV(A) lauroyltransferase
LRPLRQRLEALLLRALGATARALPFERASDLGAGIGALAYRLLKRRRTIAEENVEQSLGPLPAGTTSVAIVRAAFSQLGRTFLEFLALPAQTREEIAARVTWEGYEPMEAVAREGKGAVLVTGHFGNWELLGAAGRVHFGSMKYLLPRQTNPWSDAYLNDVRRRLGIEPFRIEENLREALRALRSGALLGMLPDQDARRAGIHVPFFGRPASTHAGPARMALAAGTPIFVGVAERDGAGHFRARLLRTLNPDPSREREAEVLRLTAELTRALEEAIRARPDHWYWIHRRWKTPQPPAPAQPPSALAQSPSALQTPSTAAQPPSPPQPTT